MILESEEMQGNLPAQNPYNTEEQATVSLKRRWRAGIALRTESSSSGRKSARGVVHLQEAFQ
jgi:hypothetical protein